MNRKEIELLALCLKQTKPKDVSTNKVARLQWYADVANIAAMIRGTLVPFDSTKFYNDCGVPT